MRPSCWTANRTSANASDRSSVASVPSARRAEPRNAIVVDERERRTVGRGARDGRVDVAALVQGEARAIGLAGRGGKRGIDGGLLFAGERRLRGFGVDTGDEKRGEEEVTQDGASNSTRRATPVEPDLLWLAEPL